MRQTIKAFPRPRLSSTRSWSTEQALLFFTVVSSLMLYPLFPDFFDKLAVGGDAAEYLWKLWWFKHSLLETGQSPWVVPGIYYPQGYLLAYGEITAANTALTIPLTWLLGEIGVYNLLVLLSTILSGFGMFLLAREISGSVGAGLLAGIIFAYAPFRYLQFIHLPIFPTQWLPFTFYFLERYARSRKPAFGLVAGLFFALAALTSWYYAVAGVLFVSIWAAARLKPWPDYLQSRQSWVAFGLFATVVLGLVLPFVWPYLIIASDTDVVIPLPNSNYYSASPTDYLLPSPFQFLWGSWVQRNLLTQIESGEFILGWGVVAWLFGLYGLRWADRPTLRPWLLVTVVATVLSFGLTLHLVGRQVVIPAPQVVVITYNDWLNTISLHSLQHESFSIGSDNGLVIPLPALLLRWFVPVIGKLRTWTRFGVIALMGMSVLAALGAAAWQRREMVSNYSPVRQRTAWGVVIALALFELWWRPAPMATPSLVRPVDNWLAAQPEQFVIIEYPLDSAFNPKQMLYWRVHKKAMVHGYTTFLSFMFSQQHPEMLTFPDQKAISQLVEWDVRYVLVETGEPYQKEANILLTRMNQESCLQQRTLQGTVYVYELTGCEP